MTKTRALRRKSIFVAAVTAAAMASTWTSVAPAATLTWDGGGGDDNWGTAANWVGDVAPVANDALVFDGAVRLVPNNNLAAGTLVAGVAFNAGAGAFTLGGNALTLGPAGNIVSNSPNAQTLGLPLTLAAGRHAITTGAGALNFTGAFTRSAGSTLAFTNGTGSVNFGGATGLANTHGIIGGYATIGGDWASLDGGGNVVAYTGYTVVDPLVNTISSGAAQNIKIAAAGGNVTMAATGTTDINTLLYSGTGANQVVDIAAGNILRLGARGGIYRTNNAGTQNLTIGTAVNTGTITAGGADGASGEIVISAAPSGGSQVVVINSNIADNGAGNAVTLIKTGGASMSIGSTGNTYSGGTYILEGRINPGTAGSGAFGTGPVYIYQGGNIFGSSATHDNAFFIGSLGWVPSTGGTEAGIGALRGGTYNGTVTLIGDSGISGNSTINGKITGNFNVLFGATTTISSTPSISNPLNDYTGNTNVVSRTNGASSTTLTLNASEVIPHGSGKGNLIIGNPGQNSGSNAILNLNGQTETVNALISSGNVALAFVQNNSATPATLIVGANDASGVYLGKINDNTGTVALTKIGTGQQTIGGGTMSGAINVNGGALVVNGSTGSGGAVNVNTADGSTLLAGNGTMGNVTLAADTGANRATLRPGTDPGTLATLTLSSLTVNGGQIQLDLGTGAAFDQISAGAVNFDGASTIALAGGVVGNTYPIIASGAAIGYAGGAPTLASAGGGDTRPTTYTLDTTTNTNQVLASVIGGGPIAIAWTGAALSDDWDINNTLNWQNGPTPEKFFNLDTVTFGDGPSDRNVNLIGTLLPGSVTVDNSTGNDYTFGGTGAIGGNAILTKAGTGTLVVTTNNTNAGGTKINGGTVQVGNGGTTGRLGPGTIENFGALVINRSDAVTLGDVISGNGSLAQNGSGTLTLTASNSHSGGTIVNAGALRLNNVNAAGSGAVAVNNNATLVFNNVSPTNAFALNGSKMGAAGGDVTLSGEVTFSGNSTVYTVDPQALTSASRNVILTGTARGSGNVTILPASNITNVDGSQGLRFRGSLASDFSGTVTLSNNVKAELQTSGASGSPAGTAKFFLTAGDALRNDTTNAATTTGGYSTFLLRNEGGNTVLGNDVEVLGSGLAILGPLGAAGDGTTTTLGTLKIGAGQELGTYRSSGAIHVPTFTSVTLGGSVTFSPRVPNFGATTAVGSDLALGNISETTPGSGITMNGARTLILTGSSNTYSGPTTVSNGTLRITGTGGLGTTGNVTNNAQLQVYSNNTLASVSGTGSTVIGDGTTGVNVEAKHVRQAELTVAAGSKLKMTADLGADGASNVGTFTIAANGKLDLNSNKLVTSKPLGTFDGFAYSGVQGDIARAYNFGTWDGPGGLMTSQDLANPLSGPLGGTATIAVNKASEVLFIGETDTAVFAGQTVTGASTIAMYTYAGDVNLDGLVDAADYGVIDNWIQFPGTDGYMNGDFNYDGIIDAADYGIIDNSIQLQGAPFPGVNGAFASSASTDAGLSGVTAVPEPASLSVVGLAAAAIFGRVRRRRSSRCADEGNA